MRLPSILVLAAAGLLSLPQARSMTAYPGVITETQPDGTIIELVGKGDEHDNYMTTKDGTCRKCGCSTLTQL